MNETVFTNARLITPDAVVEGTLVVRDGHIVSLDNGASSLAERIDLEGDYLMPAPQGALASGRARLLRPRRPDRRVRDYDRF